MEKNQEYVVEIIDHGFEGEGIAKIDGKPVFIPGAIPGETCRIVITKVLTSYAYGKLLEVQTASPHRQEPFCIYAKRCGGCQMQHIDYETTLEQKQEVVQNLVRKMLQQPVLVEKTVGMGNPYHYRNKAIFPCGIDKLGKPAMGMYAQRSHTIIPLEDCMLQPTTTMKIAQKAFSFLMEHGVEVYQEATGKGLLRHIMIRTGFQTGEIMVVVIINGKTLPQAEKLVTYLQEQFPAIATVVVNHNTKNTNVIVGKSNTVLAGTGRIEDKLGDYTFSISPQSFYQVNPVQTEALYHIALEKVGLQKNDIFCDLYCGIGTIGIFAAKQVKEVYGVEIVEEAVKDARENAKRNGITNTTFVAGDVEKLFAECIENQIVHPTIVCVDPPRKGVDGKTIEQIRKIAPQKVLYISCNPATLVRDIAKLEDKYSVSSIQPVDCFPWTKHVECIVVLQLKEDR